MQCYDLRGEKKAYCGDLIAKPRGGNTAGCEEIRLGQV